MTNNLIKKRNEILKQEAVNDETLWYLSFADEKFNGAIMVMAKGFMHAHMTVNMMGLNPGGEVQGIDVAKERWPHKKWWNRILSKQDIDNMDREFKESHQGA